MRESQSRITLTLSNRQAVRTPSISRLSTAGLGWVSNDALSWILVLSLVVPTLSQTRDVPSGRLHSTKAGSSLLLPRAPGL
jgi:hypothetical protein